MYYICASCGHEWQHAELMPDGPVAFRRPQAD
jgi:hypothetical protein